MSESKVEPLIYCARFYIYLIYLNILLHQNEIDFKSFKNAEFNDPSSIYTDVINDIH